MQRYPPWLRLYLANVAQPVVVALSANLKKSASKTACATLKFIGYPGVISIGPNR
jgi:hypothetical protein